MDKDVVYIYTVEYYSAVKKNENLPLAERGMDLEGIMLSEISQRKTNSVWYHLYVESKKERKKELIDTEVGGRQRQGLGEGGQKVQNSIYKINKSWGFHVHSDYS